MTKLEDIEQAVTRLTPEELDRFRAWFEEFQENLFDSQIERDAKDGNLDWLVSEAIDEQRAARTKPLPAVRK